MPINHFLPCLNVKMPMNLWSLQADPSRGVVYPGDYESIEKRKFQIESNEYKFDRVKLQDGTGRDRSEYVEDFGSYVIDEPLFYVFISDPQGNIDPVTGLSNKKILFQEKC